MDLHAFAQALRALPPGTLVALPRDSLLEIVEGAAGSPTGGAASGPSLVDLTVAQVAQLFGRAPGTVRQWLESGQLEGYKLFGREWRVPLAAVGAFQERQRMGAAHPGGRASRTQSLGDWRRVARELPTDQRRNRPGDERRD